MADLSASLGVRLDQWQEQVLEAAMGERSDGRWAARLVGVSAPRQQGKSQLIVARALAGVLLFGEQTIICSAHQTDTAREVFQRLLDLIDDNSFLERRVAQTMKALNREFVRFEGGATIRIKARSVSGSRGFSSDCLLLDEAQILGTPAWSSILPTMSARENPQAWLLGTPPTPQDDGEVFSRLRESGIKRESRMAYLEWSAALDDDLDDPETWAKANPAYGFRISHEAIEAERAAMSDNQFRMERLGMWDTASAAQWIIPRQSWESAGDLQSVAVDRIALGVEVGPDMGWASISLAGQRPDGNWHTELAERQDGADWVVPTVRKLLDNNPDKIRAVVADAGSPTAALFDAFDREKIRITSPKVAELGQGCTRLLDGIVTGSVFHTRQGQVDAAVAAAGKRALGDTGMWVWSRKTASADITPIQAATLALIGAQNETVKRPSSRRDRNRKVVVW